MKNYNKLCIGFCLVLVCCSLCSCKDKKKIVINSDTSGDNSQITGADGKENSGKNSISNEKKYEEKMVFISENFASSNISMVGVNDAKLWKELGKCSIDKELKEQKVERDNIRMYRNAYDECKLKWNNEIETTFTKVLKALSKDDKDSFSKQNKAYESFASCTGDVYNNMFEVLDEEDSMVRCKDYIGAARSLMLISRRYAVEQKEYYYLAKGKVYIDNDIEEKEENDDSESDDSENNDKSKKDKDNKENKERKESDKDSKKNSSQKLRSSGPKLRTSGKKYNYYLKNDLYLVSDKKFKDMTKDHYYKRFVDFNANYRKSNKNKKDAMKFAQNTYDYWKKQIEHFHNKIEKCDDDELKSIIEKQYSSWKDYNEYSEKVQSKVLSKFNRFKPTFKKDAKYDVIMLKAYRAKMYALELLQYNYLLTGKIEF